MKLKARLKKLSPTKHNYRYHVIIDEELFNNHNLNNIYNVQKCDHQVSFDCNEKALKILRESGITCIIQDNFKNRLKHNSYKMVISLIFLVVIFLAFIINQFMLREIAFANQKYQNEIVYQYVESYTKKIGPYLSLKSSIANISKELRKKFYQYAYIGLTKKGSKLLIEIVYQDVLDEVAPPDNQIGEFYANSDAVINYIDLSSGKMIVKYNDVVKKGDLLATSNLQYAENLYSIDKMVPLKGMILGNVKEYYQINVPKVEEIEVFTGKTFSYVFLDLKNRNLFQKDNPFVNSYTKTYALFSNKDSFLKKTIIYEKVNQKIIRQMADAKEYAIVKLYQDYEKNRSSEMEKIASITLVNYQENADDFTFCFLVNACKNIVEFKSF